MHVIRVNYIQFFRILRIAAKSTSSLRLLSARKASGTGGSETLSHQPATQMTIKISYVSISQIVIARMQEYE
tara:strand:- start:888 stop:1103 length:216 start_codon:yes stop_codon:yes gene_type:complete